MVSLQRVRSVGLLVVLFSLLSFPASREADATGAASPRLISADERQATVRLTVPAYRLAPAGVFWRLAADGAGSADAPGAPDLPVWRASFGVPAGAEVRLRVLGGPAERIPGSFRLLPVPTPRPSAEDLAAGTTEIIADPAAYRSASAYPAAPAAIARDAWLRDQRIVQIELAPFSYVAATGELSWRRELTVEVSWRGGQPGAAPAAGLDPAPAGLVLNPQQAAAWRSLPERPAAGLAPSQPPAPRYKLVVDQDGMYRVTRAELAAAGMPVDTVDPRTFRLTSQGRDIAISVPGEADGRFDAGDEVRFYGQRYATKVISDTFIDNGALVTRPSLMSAYYSDATSYTDETVYWLTSGGAPGPRMAAIDAAPISGAPVAPSYREQVHAEESYRWYSTQFLSRDKWMWGRLNLPLPGGAALATFTATASLSALAPAGGPAQVRSEIQSLVHNAFVEPDHRTRFALYDPATAGRTELEDATWDGLALHHLDAPAPQAALREGLNYLELTAYLQPGMSADQLFFNWFEIEYDRRFEAVGDALAWPGRTAGSWNYQVGGFSAADLLAFDVSNPALPHQLFNGVVSASGGGQQIALGAAGAAGSRYLAVSAAALRAPKRLSAYAPPDLRAASNGADYIFISHANFLTATQTLADYRAGQGLRTMVVDIEDVYNEFNDGIVHPVAIKRFLAYAYATWQGAPVAYALLVGDGHWNLKNFAPPAGPLPPGQPAYTDYRAGPAYMPPLLAWVDPYQGEVDSTNLLAAFVGEDILPDLSIGRLPVNTPAQAQAAVAKTIAFEQAPAADWQRRMTFVADNTPDPAGDFVQLSEQIIDDHMPDGWVADRIYLDDICGQTTPPSPPSSCPAMNQQIISTLNVTGTLFLNYTGHASLNRWAGEQIFVNANVPSLANGDKLPIVLSMTCLDGYWLYPNLPGLMEEMIRADNRGAVAAFSPTGLGVASGHDVMQRGFYDGIFNDGMRRLGPATIAGKAVLASQGAHDDLINTFAILGDPALKLPLPAPALRFYLPLVRR